MKLHGKLIAIGLALATVTGVATATPAAAQSRVYVGVGSGYGGGYQQVGWRDDYGYRDRGNWGRGDRRWDRRGWRGDNGWRGDRRWRGGYRERCWTEWRRGRWNDRVPVRICR